MRFARSSSFAGPLASASNSPSSLAANKCFAAIKPIAIFRMGSGVTAAVWSLNRCSMVLPLPGDGESLPNVCEGLSQLGGKSYGEERRQHQADDGPGADDAEITSIR